MKRLKIIIFLIILSNIFPVQGSEDVKNLTIKALRDKKIPENSINIEKKLGVRNGKYTSYLISYYSENLNIYALMNIPLSKKPEKGYPVVLVNHGYIPPARYSTVDSYRLVDGYFASNGFITLKSDYRGHASSDKGTNRPVDRMKYVLDVLYLTMAVGSIDGADPGNIFMYGHSMGGEITLKALEISSNIKAASLWAPVTKRFPESMLYFVRKRSLSEAINEKEKIERIFGKSNYSFFSPIDNISLIEAPLIIHHGTGDDSVPYNWSLELVEKLKESGVNYKFYTYDDDHNFAGRYFYVVLKRDVAFFKKYL